MKNFAGVAQLVEHFLGKEEAMGSSPIASLRVTCYKFVDGKKEIGFRLGGW